MDSIQLSYAMISSTSQQTSIWQSNPFTNFFVKGLSNLLQPIRQWLDNLEVHNRQFARFIAKLIPDQCPFERDIILLGHKILHIPPMCKLNPLYEQLVGLRFRALCYLVDQCGESI